MKKLMKLLTGKQPLSITVKNLKAVKNLLFLTNNAKFYMLAHYINDNIDCLIEDIKLWTAERVNFEEDIGKIVETSQYFKEVPEGGVRLEHIFTTEDY